MVSYGNQVPHIFHYECNVAYCYTPWLFLLKVLVIFFDVCRQDGMFHSNQWIVWSDNMTSTLPSIALCWKQDGHFVTKKQHSKVKVQNWSNLENERFNHKIYFNFADHFLQAKVMLPGHQAHSLKSFCNIPFSRSTFTPEWCKTI